MAELNITFGERRGDRARCGYCFVRLEGEFWRCSGCESQLHYACHDELSCCPTLGCEEVILVRSEDGRHERRARGRAHEKLRLAGILVFDGALLAVLYPLIISLTFIAVIALFRGFWDLTTNTFISRDGMSWLLSLPLLATVIILGSVLARWRSLIFQENVRLGQYYFLGAVYWEGR
ncbi:MAG: hypothetical protein P1V97_09205 [Planctomycetota bacterium]|nr:hypothetical protein [Planctomycetota bacterium]